MSALKKQLYLRIFCKRGHRIRRGFRQMAVFFKKYAENGQAPGLLTETDI